MAHIFESGRRARAGIPPGISALAVMSVATLILTACFPVIAPDRTAPGAPRDVAAVADTGAARVSWRRPLDDGGAVLTRYTAWSEQAPERTCEVSATDTACVIVGLSADAPHTFVVRAYNRKGAGKVSAPSAPVTPIMAPPGIPTGLVIVPGPLQLHVSWTAPLYTGGANTLSYVASVAGDSTVSCIPSESATACVLSGLVEGALYEIEVRAQNAAGMSAPSARSSMVTPRSPRPDLPRNVVVTAGNQRVTVSWQAPLYTGIGAITGYAVTAVGDTTVLCETGGGLSCIIPGLINDSTYTFAVTAHNGSGKSTPVSTSPVMPHRFAEWTSYPTTVPSFVYSSFWTGNQFVVVGAGGHISTSPDGLTWTKQTSGTTVTLWSVAIGNGLIVAVGAGSTIRTSPNGITWTARSISQTAVTLRSVIWARHAIGPGVGQFVAVGSNTANSIGSVYTSPDGITWTQRATGLPHLWSVTWVPPADSTLTTTGYYVSTGQSGAIRTSFDVVNWTTRTSGTTQGLSWVAWGRPANAGAGVVYLTVGTGGTMLRSTDGFNWTPIVWRQGGNPGVELTSVEWIDSQFIAVGYQGYFMTSPDGLNWKVSTIGLSSSFRGLAYGNGKLVTTGSNPGIILTSP